MENSLKKLSDFDYSELLTSFLLIFVSSCLLPVLVKIFKMEVFKAFAMFGH